MRSAGSDQAGTPGGRAAPGPSPQKHMAVWRRPNKTRGLRWKVEGQLPTQREEETGLADAFSGPGMQPLS